jgi:hypothetical protein
MEEYRALKALKALGSGRLSCTGLLMRAGTRPGPVMVFLTVACMTRWKRWWPISALANVRRQPPGPVSARTSSHRALVIWAI